jgi:L-alanine-DL-glutamate epimerase-like enolase superfamily enzyme
VGQPLDDPESLLFAALWSNNAVHAAGIGMRALSVVDIAAWDLAAKSAGQGMAAFLGGERQSMPVTGIVGYPPSISPADTVRSDLPAVGARMATLQAAHRAHARRVHRSTGGCPGGLSDGVAGHRRQLLPQDGGGRHRLRSTAR